MKMNVTKLVYGKIYVLNHPRYTVLLTWKTAVGNTHIVGKLVRVRTLRHHPTLILKLTTCFIVASTIKRNPSLGIIIHNIPLTVISWMGFTTSVGTILVIVAIYCTSDENLARERTGEVNRIH